MLENNTTLLGLYLDLSVNSCQFLNITNGLKMNSTLLETKLSFYAVDLNCLMLIFEEVAVSKLNFSLYSSTHFIDVNNGAFCFSPHFCSDYTMSSEELSSLRCFLECFSIKKLTLKKCKFTKESITSLCDLIRSNISLTSVEFSDLNFVKLTPNGTYQRIDNFDSYHNYSNLINAIQCNSRLTKVTLINRNMGLKTLLNIFELVSTNKLTSNIDVSPHLIDLSRGSICYTPSQMSNDELVLMVDLLRQNRDIKHFECPLYQIDTNDDVFCLQGIGNNEPKVTVEFVSSLQCFLECFITKESITALCDLIKCNNSLTSVDFSDFLLRELTPNGFYQRIDNLRSYDHYSNLINAIQCNSRLTKVTLSDHDMGVKTLLTIFELVSNNKLTSNIDVSPHLIDFSSNCIYFHNRVEDDDLICLLNALKSNIPVKSVDCKGSSSITLTGLIALFEILSFNKSFIDVDISPNLINVDNGVFCFNGNCSSKLRITTNECISLQNFLNCFNIKSLVLKVVCFPLNLSLFYVIQLKLIIH
ncbi:hypothetical protein GEMRC1_013607 [Eukaryota sp. GEM-RC1]